MTFLIFSKMSQILTILLLNYLDYYLLMYFFQTSPSAKALAADLLTPAPKLSQNVTPSKELHLHAKARYQKELREELLGKKYEGINSLS